ncbi:MerR family transcriptional regulator [Bosea sp. CS1GBMeth4]|uniref:MerR family transcriptional regulator n=1 Tax=Bosea sp. CS1GBMeth4 TaxID=1892849 RepID=UPI001FCF1BEF|nr:MerR family transcriptional regulator [Bosea sp. CS1GBMeth4]
MSAIATFTIGELAEEFGVTPRALRFYEERGLLTPTRDGSDRRYRDVDRARLAQILEFSRMGFTLSEIKAGKFSPEKLKAQLEYMREQQTQAAEAIRLLERLLASNGSEGIPTPS